MAAKQYFRPLPSELVAVQQKMEAHARDYGLDFFPTIFEVVDADQLNAIAAYGGFPTRYPHWRFGMEYDQLSKGYSYGLQKIYESRLLSNLRYDLKQVYDRRQSQELSRTLAVLIDGYWLRSVLSTQPPTPDTAKELILAALP